MYLSVNVDEESEESMENQKESDDRDQVSTPEGKFVSHKDSMKKHKKLMTRKSE